MDLAHPLLALAGDEPPLFPASQPQLRRLDQSVICEICKDIYDAPVSIACGHSFCSACIRSALDVMKKCPSCQESAPEGSIRRNRALEEIVHSWEEARPTLITLAQPTMKRKRPPPKRMSESSSSGSGTAKRARQRSASVRRSEDNVRPLGDDSEDGDDEPVELNENGSHFRPGLLLTLSDEGECPICQARLPISSIPMHIERGCLPVRVKAKANGTGNQKADWKKVFAGAGAGKGKEVEMKRITKPNYHLISPVDLRAILAEHSLPTTGDKAVLASRVQEWITLFNSNLDSSIPKSLSALRARLNEAEASRKRDKDKGKDDLGIELGTKEGMEKYAKERKPEFERLRSEIMERDKKRAGSSKAGMGVESPIEVD